MMREYCNENLGMGTATFGQTKEADQQFILLVGLLSSHFILISQ